jgi:long-chain fatty acid transport protein
VRRLACVLALVASRAEANPIDAFGFGARAPAMAGAHTAAARDGSANYYNPAALALGEVIEIDLGYQLAEPALTINGLDQEVDQSRGLVGSLSAPGRIAGIPFALGVALFLPDERVARARTLPAGKPRWALYDNRPQRIFLASHLAARILPNLWLGAGVAYMSRTKGTVDLEGRVGFPDADDSDLDVGIDVDLVTIRYPQAGVLWRAVPWLDVGLTYRHQFKAKFDQGFRIDGDIGPEGMPIVEDGFFELHSVALDLFQPMQIAAGVAARLGERWLVAADLTYQRWSRFKNPSAHIELDLDLKDFNDLVDLPPRPPLPSPEFHDIFVPRLGVEWLAAEGSQMSWRARAGYAWEPSPAPEQTEETNFVDNDKHTFSLGVGLEVARVTEILPRPFDLDAYVALTVLPARSHAKLSPIDPVGDYVSKGRVLAGGITTRWHF